MWGGVSGTSSSYYRGMGHWEDKESPDLTTCQSLPRVPQRGTCAKKTSGKLPERPKCFRKCTLAESDTRVGGMGALGVAEQRGEA